MFALMIGALRCPRVCVLLVACLLPRLAGAVDIVTLTAPESSNDPRTAYNVQLVHLAL